ncbi:MAG TPA: YihY/virulence factor BrkB family protein [Anaerolineae bacterium]|nr:YihY/virulence factor BrkB family protein [Anaerolineae bacterium]
MRERIEALMGGLRRWLAAAYARLDAASGGRFGPFGAALEGFVKDDCPLVAAAIAYYALFSFFPLVLFLVALGSSVLRSPEVQRRALEFALSYLPAYGELIERNIRQVLALRGEMGALSALALLWSASGVFSALEGAINRAWGVEGPRPFWRGKLMGLTMVLVIGLGLVLSTFLTALLNLMQRWQVPLLGWRPFGSHFPWGVAMALAPSTFTLFAFLLLYKFVPYAKVRWSDALRGAALAALLWEGAKNLFAWYMASGLAHYNLVYGSLSAIVVLVLWAYITGLIILVGAELSAAFAKARR